MRPSTSSANLSTQILRALLASSSRTWSPTHEQTLHTLIPRNSLTPRLVSTLLSSLPHSLALGFFHWASQQPNFTHTPLTYHSLLTRLSQHSPNSLTSVLKQLKSQKIALNSSTYDHVIKSLVKNNKAHKALLMYNEVRGNNTCVGDRACNSLLAGLGAGRWLGDARKMFDEMVGRGFGFRTAGFGVFVWRFSESGEIGEVLRMVEGVMGRGDGSGVNGSIVAVLVVDGLCKGKRVEEAFWVLDELRGRGCKPDFMAYWVVAEGFRRMGNVVEMEKVLKRKRKLGVAPRAGDYNEFVLELVAEGRVVEAKELGEIIVGGNFPIEDDVLNMLIGSVSAFDVDSALQFTNFMVGKGRLPSLVTLHNLSNNLCKHGKGEELLEVFQILSSNDYFSDEESYGVMVKFLCKAGRVREAYGALQEIKKNGFEPDVSLYNAILEACCKEDMLRPAKRLWDEMFANRCPGNLETYNILISKFSEIGQLEEAQRLFHHMLNKELKPDAWTYKSLLGGLCQESKLDVAFEVFNKSMEQDKVLARNILSTFVSFLCENGHYNSACKLLCGLNSEIGHSDSHVVVLKYLAAARELPMAIEHINYVQKTYPSMLQVIFTELLTLATSSNRQEQILQLLKRIQENCQLSDNLAWDNLRNNSFDSF